MVSYLLPCGLVFCISPPVVFRSVSPVDTQAKEWMAAKFQNFQNAQKCIDHPPATPEVDQSNKVTKGHVEKSQHFGYNGKNPEKS